MGSRSPGMLGLRGSASIDGKNPHTSYLYFYGHKMKRVPDSFGVMPQRIFDKCSEIAASRKRPLLLFQNPEIIRSDLLTVCDSLKGKIFPALDVIIQTPGGDADAAYLVTKVLRKHAKTLSFLIPVYAKSAGTLMCLGADELVVTEITELGPLDRGDATARSREAAPKS